jgi:hypothetical protein
MFDAARLYGYWQLQSFIEQEADGKWIDARGPNPKGSICYLPDGHMQVLIGSRDRPRFRGAWSTIPAAEKALCVDRMVAYGGRYTIGADRVTHHVDICWIPNWEGRDLVRLVTFPRQDHLLLRTPEPSGERPQPAQEVLWVRTVPSVG